MLCASRKVISSLVMSLLNVPWTPIPPILSSPTTTPTPPTGRNQTGPVRDSALGGGPSGHLADPAPKFSFVGAPFGGCCFLLRPFWVVLRNMAKTKLADWSRACTELKVLPTFTNLIYVNLICADLGGFRRGTHSAALFHHPKSICDYGSAR